MVSEEDVLKAVEEVVDPEVGVSIVEMNLIDDIKIEDGKVTITYHLTVPFCPAMFALAIAQDIKQKVAALEGVEKVRVILKDHYMAEEVNRQINPD
jgi:metal-sulfur cluster biosynthetic enzyme